MGKHSFFKNIYLLFGCIRSQLQYTGSSLHHAGYFLVTRRIFLPHSMWDFCSLTRDGNTLTGRVLMAGLPRKALYVVWVTIKWAFLICRFRLFFSLAFFVVFVLFLFCLLLCCILHVSYLNSLVLFCLFVCL